MNRKQSKAFLTTISAGLLLMGSLSLTACTTDDSKGNGEQSNMAETSLEEIIVTEPQSTDTINEYVAIGNFIITKPVAVFDTPEGLPIGRLEKGTFKVVKTDKDWAQITFLQKINNNETTDNKNKKSETTPNNQTTIQTLGWVLLSEGNFVIENPISTKEKNTTEEPAPEETIEETAPTEEEITITETE